MSEPIYRLTDIVGTSNTGVEDAVRSGIDRARRTLRGLDWFEVSEIRGAIAAEDTINFQVTMKVGFRLDGDEEG